jgi:uncharacterized membrane protein (UPF0127 family)
MGIINRLNKNLFFIFSAFLIASSAALSAGIDDRQYNHKLQIINGSNGEIITDFNVKIAKDDSSQEKGLMFVEKLPEDYGLLFDFKSEKISYMWMKNTLIYLDIIFIDKNNKIVNIEQSARPLSEKYISSKLDVTKVLEINGGLVKKLDITIGDKIKVVK